MTPHRHPNLALLLALGLLWGCVGHRAQPAPVPDRTDTFVRTATTVLERLQRERAAFVLAACYEPPPATSYETARQAYSGWLHALLRDFG